MDGLNDTEDAFAEEEAQRRRTRNRWALIIVGAGIAVGIVTYILTRRQATKDQAVIAEQDQQSGSIIGTVGQKFGWSADGTSYTFHPTTPPPGIESPPGYSNYYAGNWYEDTPSSVVPDIPDEWKSYPFITKDNAASNDVFNGSLPSRVHPNDVDKRPPVTFVRGKFFNKCPRWVPNSFDPLFTPYGMTVFWDRFDTTSDDQCKRWVTAGNNVTISDPFYAARVNCGPCVTDSKGKCLMVEDSTGKKVVAYDYVAESVRCQQTSRETDKSQGYYKYVTPNPAGKMHEFLWNPNEGGVTVSGVGTHWLTGDGIRHYCPKNTTMVTDGLYTGCALNCAEGTIPALPNFGACTRLGIDAKSVPIDINTIPGRPVPPTKDDTSTTTS